MPTRYGFTILGCSKLFLVGKGNQFVPKCDIIFQSKPSEAERSPAERSAAQQAKQ
jgi:hypothetical protein